MQFIHTVVISSTLIHGAPEGEARLCLNRLVWGGCQVSVLLEEGLAPPQESAGTFGEGVSTLTYEAGSLESLQQTLVQAATSPKQLLFVSDAQTALSKALLEGLQGVLVWLVDPSEQTTCPDRLTSLRHLPRHVAMYQQQVADRSAAGEQVAVVGYAMAAKREKELAALTPSRPQAADNDADNTGVDAYHGGLLCLIPQQQLVFMPLDVHQALDPQLPFQVVLHKASDELEAGPGGRPRYAGCIQRLQQWLASHPDIKVIDPLDCTSKVIDRLELSSVLNGLNVPDDLNSPGNVKVAVGCPKHVIVDDINTVHQAITGAGFEPPYIIKPAVACGLPGSHRMLLVLANQLLPAALQAGQLPLPVVIQEFRNHGGSVAKVYVAGDKVFHTWRPSIPDLPPAWTQAWSAWDAAQHVTDTHAPQHVLTVPGTAALQAHSLAADGWMVFDSLKSLPTAHWLPQDAHSSNCIAGAGPQGHLSDSGLQNVFECMASQLRQLLGLSLFGFDVIAIPLESDKSVALHVIDVNYLPNYRVPGAATHVWHVIHNRCFNS